ncbi:MAG: metallophosphoesterase [Proteobacteria bacterium]|nr:metallophosphoesterase [Pseudomonadota bacterium]
MQRIFVGDVQGCADELEELIDRAAGEFGDDFELWLVGDLVNRGPGSLRVLRRVRELVERGRARCVLGNHDLQLVRIGLGLAELGPDDTYGDVLEAPEAQDWLDWLRKCPLLESGLLEGEGPGRAFAMVHASVHPDWSLEELESRARRIEARLRAPEADAAAFLSGDPRSDPDLDDLLRMVRGRSVTAEGAWSSHPPAEPEGAWHAHWSVRSRDYGVVYGHWARQGLHVAPGLRGLDTGCVHHQPGRKGRLTAWLPGWDGARAPAPGAGRFSLPDERFWHVPAHRIYYTPRAEVGAIDISRQIEKRRDFGGNSD